MADRRETLEKSEDLRRAEVARPRKPRGVPRERRVNVGEGEPAAEAVSAGRDGPSGQEE